MVVGVHTHTYAHTGMEVYIFILVNKCLETCLMLHKCEFCQDQLKLVNVGILVLVFQLFDKNAKLTL